MDALLDVSEELNEGLLTLTDHQAYMRRREEHHAAVWSRLELSYCGGPSRRRRS